MGCPQQVCRADAVALVQSSSRLSPSTDPETHSRHAAEALAYGPAHGRADGVVARSRRGANPAIAMDLGPSVYRHHARVAVTVCLRDGQPKASASSSTCVGGLRAGDGTRLHTQRMPRRAPAALAPGAWPGRCATGTLGYRWIAPRSGLKDVAYCDFILKKTQP
jgi:hypothetical protein